MSETMDVMPHDEIKLGSFLLTIVEPHKGHEVAYNRWYERDHFYSGCMIGPWTLAGGRYVATKDCKALRTPEPNEITEASDRGSYIALYWIQDGKYKDWVVWGGKQVMWLHENGRMFQEREHVHTQLYKVQWTHNRDEDGVPPELALDHPFKGIVTVFGEAAEGTDPADVDRWYQEEHLPRALAGSPAALVVAATPRELRRGPSDVPRAEGSERKFAHLYFLDSDPREAWADHFADHGAEFEKSGLGRIQLASPFLTTIPGTDTYTDQLW
jgi:hypothetical protein